MPTGVPASGRRKRRGKKTLAAIKTILKKIRDGTPDNYAVIAGGVCKQTWYRWLKEDPKLKAAAEFASACAVDDAFADIKQAGRGDKEKGIAPIWQARAWFLERCHGFVATLDVRQTPLINGDDIEFKVQFSDGQPLPVIADADDEAVSVKGAA